MSAPLSIPSFDELPSTEDIVQISQWLKTAGLSSLELSNTQGTRLRICIDKSETPAPAVNPQTQPDTPLINTIPSNQFSITAPYFGNLLLHNPVTNNAFAPEGYVVAADETVAMLQIGELTVPITAPQSGTVVHIKAQEGDLISYGQAILTILPN